MSPVAVNPNSSQLGRVNAILQGRSRSYYVHDFPGPLSIKSVVRGTGMWEIARSRFPIGPDSFVILNQGQSYSMTIDSDEPVETFCLFFREGFVEDAWRALTSSASQLLDDPFDSLDSLGFFERIHPKAGSLAALLARMHDDDAEERDDTFIAVANSLLTLQSGLERERARIPVAKSSTRSELFHRLSIARSFIESSVGDPLRLEQIAHVAGLSMFHLHRLFSTAFGETPHDYLTRRRLERATRLLAETEMPVTLICLESGFQSLGSFSSLFRKRTGVSPKQYRARFAINKTPGPV